MRVQKTNNQQTFGMNKSTEKNILKTLDIATAGVKSVGDAFICAHTGAPYQAVDVMYNFDTLKVLRSLNAFVKRLFINEPAVTGSRSGIA